MKKFLAGLLTLAMAVSMLTMTTFAEENNDQSNNAVQNIDESETGSITIHKYIKDESKTWPDSTGNVLENNTSEESQDTSKLPYGAAALDGVTFSIYQIVDKDKMLAYYSGDQERAKDVKIPTQDQLTGKEWNEGNACTKQYMSDNWILDTSGPWKNAKPIGSLTTGKDGQATGEVKFEGLELGIYLVIETDSPDMVAAPADPFLVSIPMTINNEWKYDVHVYPKNATIVSGDVQIAKGGKVAGTTSLSPLQGVKFQLQKKTTVKNEWGDSSTTWVPVTQTEDRFGNTTPLGDNGIITSQQDGLVTVSSLAPGVYRFVEIQTVDGYILLDNGAWYFKIDSNGDVIWSGDRYAGGYGEYYGTNYLVSAGLTWYEEPGEDELLGGGTGSNDVMGGIPYAINERPDVEKKVVPKGTPYEEKESVNMSGVRTGTYNEYEEYDKEADYSVGDVIPYKLTIQVPQNASQLSTFIVYDTPTNMTDDLDSIKVLVIPNRSNALVEISVNPTRYGETGFQIDFSDIRDNLYYIKEIIITYTATLSNGESVTAKDGNPNEVTLEYSSSCMGTGTSKITDRTVVYSGEIDVHKTDGTATGKLSGVEFELYEQQDATIKPGDKIGEGDKQKTTLTSAQAIEKGLDNPTTTAYVQIGGTYTTDGGKTSMKGLSDGTYWLVETKTAEGYNLLEKPIKVELALGYSTVMKDNTSEETKWTCEEIKDADNNITGYILNKNEITSTTKTATVNEAGETEPGSQIITIETEGGGEKQCFGVSKEIINRQGFTLPTTGGMGTFLFTFVGIAMMAAAVILFITSKKKEVK